MSLSSQEKKSFDSNGYLLKKDLISPQLIAQIRQELVDIHQRMVTDPPADVMVSWEDEDAPDERKIIRQLMHSELVSSTINRILRSDALVDIVAELMHPQVALYHSKLLPKEAGVGAATPWHQDYAYWKTDENRPMMLNCQFAIDPMTLENGCLEFIPGSHRWGLQEHERHEEAFGVFLPGRYYKREEGVTIPMEPGDAIFFTSLVIHGSAPNRSRQPRWANTLAYNVPGNGARQVRELLRQA
jgi:ectoine hydroxylase-related dioxygenase (phytanoyl-CoA dioxygenase family)